MAAQSAEMESKTLSDSQMRQRVQHFLDCIAWGRQNEAEAMLMANKEIALASGRFHRPRQESIQKHNRVTICSMGFRLEDVVYASALFTS